MNENRTAVADLREGCRINDCFLIDGIRLGVTKQGNAYFTAELYDMTGRITAVCWAPDGSVTAEQNGSVVTVIGTVNSYNGKPQICLDYARPVDPSEIGPELLTALVPSAPINVDGYVYSLFAMMDLLRDRDIQALCRYVLDQRKEQFISYPAAKSIHHAFLHGLLMHSLDMARIAYRVCDLYPNAFSRDLLVAGALLHDVGKLEEFEVSPVTGLVVGYTERGNLLHHSVLGAEIIRQAAAVTGARAEVSNLLQHMVLSHHGDPSYGAAAVPMTIEAEMLHCLDMIDSRKEIFKKALANTPPGEFSPKIYALDRRIYQHTLETYQQNLREV